MLFRLLKMRIAPGKFDAWQEFTRDSGFPGMLRQPGCQAIWRLRTPGDDSAFHVMTQWASADDLARFNASEDKKLFSQAAAGLTIPPYDETLYEVLPDKPRTPSGA